MLSDIEIARAITLIRIEQIAEQLGIDPKAIEPYGRYKAKIPLEHIQKGRIAKSKLILVSAMSPTPSGEGKTTTSIGLNEALNKIGKRCVVALREPSLGPVFGMKGGATGGGYAQVLPMEDINLHFTGDFAAVEKAHNLLAALIDNHIHHKLQPRLEPRNILWKRVMDMNDRSLRKILIGLGGTTQGVPRETGFDITVASEIMAILCFSQSLQELKERFERILVGFTEDKEPVYAKDLQAAGAMAALMKDAVLPNLVQTLEGNPAIIHGGPFANIAQGTNSLLATQMALSYGDYVVTEAGFGFDLGGEKFLDLKCTAGGLVPRLVVIVATIKALKYHGGVSLKELPQPNPAAVERGFANLQRHLHNVKKFGLPAVVAVNSFPTDTKEEYEVLRGLCRQEGADAIISEVFAKGGEGGIELAEAVVSLADKTTHTSFQPLYKPEHTMKQKIDTLVREFYGGAQVSYTSQAQKDLERIEKLGYGHLPICMAKTQYSFSDDPSLLGSPEGFTLTIREITLSAGAGFVVPIAGEIMRMPGLPVKPAAHHIDIDTNGQITGLS